MGALHKPNGIAANSYSPECVVEAVFIDSGAMLTCQYPETRSYVESTSTWLTGPESHLLGEGETHPMWPLPSVSCSPKRIVLSHPSW